MQFDYDTTTTKNWHVHFCLSRILEAGAHDMSWSYRSRIAIVITALVGTPSTPATPPASTLLHANQHLATQHFRHRYSPSQCNIIKQESRGRVQTARKHSRCRLICRIDAAAACLQETFTLNLFDHSHTAHLQWRHLSAFNGFNNHRPPDSWGRYCFFITSVRDVKSTRPTWPEGQFFGLGLGLLVSDGLRLVLSLVQRWPRSHLGWPRGKSSKSGHEWIATICGRVFVCK